MVMLPGLVATQHELDVEKILWNPYGPEPRCIHEYARHRTYIITGHEALAAGMIRGYLTAVVALVKV
jgi:hypothetical protein